ncbi:hypothetical protein M5D96_009023 [Drosophila gunungcola]|uniref:Uncharacterized protein n=1 Tax=Drosophila gunungcola TaxID=103775 RepID=A0A9Q0BMJ2_9MUSC|nr:hypothetical protein M5D96_009023 [Drosophila gunungcola]
MGTLRETPGTICSYGLLKRDFLRSLCFETIKCAFKYGWHANISIQAVLLLSSSWGRNWFKGGHRTWVFREVGQAESCYTYTLRGGFRRALCSTGNCSAGVVFKDQTTACVRLRATR